MLRNYGFTDEENSDFVKIRVRKKTDFHFINVDLSLESTENVQPLIQELGEDVSSLYCSDIDEMGNLELSINERKGLAFYDSYDDKKDLAGGVDIHILEFCKLIENLSAESKQIWNKCHRKEFDIGLECGNTPKSFHTQIQAETIGRCAKLGATILITIYPYTNVVYRSKKDLKQV